jgi:hypothetical protein
MRKRKRANHTLAFSFSRATLTPHRTRRILMAEDYDLAFDDHDLDLVDQAMAIPANDRRQVLERLMQEHDVPVVDIEGAFQANSDHHLVLCLVIAGLFDRLKVGTRSLSLSSLFS